MGYLFPTVVHLVHHFDFQQDLRLLQQNMEVAHQLQYQDPTRMLQYKRIGKLSKIQLGALD